MKVIMGDLEQTYKTALEEKQRRIEEQDFGHAAAVGHVAAYVCCTFFLANII